MRAATPTAFLMHGFIGSGKTTCARRLEHERPALRFTHDEWMHALWGPNPPAAEFEAARPRVAGLIWRVALQALALGNDVVLDFGFWTRASRDEARARLTAAGFAHRLLCFDAPEAVLRARVARRNAALPAEALFIDPATFTALWRGFEPLAPDEACEHADPATV